jgi:hypothetical protein
MVGVSLSEELNIDERVSSHLLETNFAHQKLPKPLIRRDILQSPKTNGTAAPVSDNS